MELGSDSNCLPEKLLEGGERHGKEGEERQRGSQGGSEA
jgi:hypothetical protein